MSYLSISIGAVLGANARYLIGNWLTERLGSGFPWATFLINVSGSLAIGIVLGLAGERVMPSWWRTGLAVGFLGAYTTFSTFSSETLELLRGGNYVAALANAGGSVVVGLAAVSAGLLIAKGLNDGLVLRALASIGDAVGGALPGGAGLDEAS